MLPKILFPFSPGSGKVDLSFEQEMEAAKSVGFETALLGSAALQFGGEVETKRVVEGDSLLYRGWILEDKDYTSLEASLLNNFGAKLIQKFEDYAWTRDFPAWYRTLRQWTPKSFYYPCSKDVKIDFHWLIDTLSEIWGDFGRPLLLKDYVKSRKQDWHDACYIPTFNDIERVVTNFLKIQGEYLVGGLVFRQFMPFQQIGVHPKSKMPLINEHRQFYLDGKMFYQAPYWSDGADYSKYQDEPNTFAQAVSSIKSRFVAVDVALAENHGYIGNDQWMIVEINDGGSSGIPDGGNVEDFYRSLKKAL